MEVIPELPKVLDAQYFSNSNNIILTLSTGDIISVSDGSSGRFDGFGGGAGDGFFGEPPDLYDEDPTQYLEEHMVAPVPELYDIPDGSASIEIVGSIAAGISAAKWSPDEEILAVVTKASTFVLLSRIFEPISETSISSADHSISKHVSVGWGKKETQFQGRGARAQRDPTMPEKVDLGALSDSDNREAEISWRGDGEVVSIITIDTDPIERRTVRVYTRNGTLDSVSEPVDGLIGLVSWRPSGNLIASLQRHDATEESPEVVFFERNGLRRGQFSLRTKSSEQVSGLAWNSDSDCLAVCLSDRVQLWTTKNYHWYLKQEISVSGGLAPVKLTWHPEKSHNLFITYEDVSIHVCRLQWDITRGTTAPPTDNGLVAVVDGHDIKLTPLAIANTPPPMCFKTLRVPATPTHVAISNTNSRFAILSGYELIIADWNINDATNKGIRDIKNPEIKATIPLDEAISGIDAPKQVAMVGNEHVFFVVDNEDGTSDVVTLRLIESGDSITHEILSANTVPEQVYLLKSLPDGEGAVIQTINGAVLGFRESLTDVATIGNLPRRCDAIEVFFPEAQDEDDEFEDYSPVVFGLHSSGRLYANDKQVTTGATSLCMTDKYLAFTTAQHYLKFCHLAQPDLISVPEDTSVDDERCRAIERGSLIVTAMPSKSAFTLQAPRGNLETFYPRIMTLTHVREDIKRKRYDLAFSTCRVHRIDLNLLYDYQPQQFIDSVELFIRQMKTTDYIDLFLSGLQEADVALTKYKETIEEVKQASNGLSNLQITEYTPIVLSKVEVKEENKVNKICDSILSVLTRDAYKVEYRQCILTAYACKTPPALEDALEMVGKTRESDPELTNYSIQHLCFLQDVNLLYDTALGIYDLPLTLLIAQQSTKDPKEYLSFLRNLQSLEEVRRQFEIDTYLKRFPKALVHLAALGDAVFDELQDYVVEHELYKEALDIFKYDVAKQDKILALQAAFMYSRTEFEQAGLVYEMLQDYENALDSYLRGDCWQQALCIVERNAGGLFADKLTEVAEGLAEKTYEAHNYRAAATIQLEYLKNPVQATRILCAGFLFDEALRVAAQQEGRYDELVELTIDPGLLEGFAQISELVADCNAQIKSQVSRINELRTKKAQDPHAFFGGMNGDEDELDVPDNVSIAASETSTAPSFFTRYTGKTGGTAKTGASRKTAKNRRREERKRARGKKGSAYEEEYLVNSMGRLVERLHETQAGAGRLVAGLLRRGMRTHAHTVQTAYAEVMEVLAGCVGEVFVLSERDRERYDEEGEVYYIPQIAVPVVKLFPKSEALNY